MRDRKGLVTHRRNEGEGRERKRTPKEPDPKKEKPINCVTQFIGFSFFGALPDKLNLNIIGEDMPQSGHHYLQ